MKISVTPIAAIKIAAAIGSGRIHQVAFAGSRSLSECTRPTSSESGRGFVIRLTTVATSRLTATPAIADQKLDAMPLR